MTQQKQNGKLIAIITMIFLFGMISFVTNLAAPMGIVLKNQFSVSNALGMLGNFGNFIAYAVMGIPSGILLQRVGYKKTALIAVAVGFIGVGIQYLSGHSSPDMAFAVYLIGAFIAGFSMCLLNTVVNPMLNKLGGENGVGILDIVENRLIGMKDHGIYETPGGTILYFAHEQLEMLTLDKETLHMKEKLAVDYADLIYNGKWYTPLQEALTAFAKKANEFCTGTVKIKLYKGNLINAGIVSPYSLYSENLVTFGESDFNQAEAEGFINIWGLPTKVQALREQGKL